MNDIERLEAVINYTKLSSRKFAIDLGYSPEAIYLVLRGNDPLNDKIISRIINRYPEINKQWLISGAGEMLLHDSNNQITMITEERIKTIEEDVRLIKRMLTKLLDQQDDAEKKSAG